MSNSLITKDKILKSIYKAISENIDSEDVITYLDYLKIPPDEVDSSSDGCTVIYYGNKPEEDEDELDLSPQNILSVLEENNIAYTNPEKLDNTGLGWDMDGNELKNFYVTIDVEDLLLCIQNSDFEEQIDGSEIIDQETKEAVDSNERDYEVPDSKKHFKIKYDSDMNAENIKQQLIDEFEYLPLRDEIDGNYYITVEEDNGSIYFNFPNIEQYIIDHNDTPNYFTEQLESINGIHVLSISMEDGDENTPGSINIECLLDDYTI